MVTVTCKCIATRKALSFRHLRATSYMALFISWAVISLLMVAPLGRWTPFAHLPATILHELSHWGVALLCGCRPSLPSIWPHKDDNGGWMLGHVTFIPGLLSGGLVALAPVFILAPVWVWVAFFRVPTPDWGTEFATGVLAGTALVGSKPSVPDLVIALKYPLGTALAGLGAWATLQVTGLL